MNALTAQTSSDTKIIKICDRLNEILIALVILLIPTFFIILTRDQFELPKLTIFRILTCFMLGTWGVRIVAARKIHFRKTPLDIPILVWAALQIVTTFISVSGYVSYRGEYENFRGLITVLNYAVLYFVAVNFIRTREQINRMLFIILFTGLLVTAYGIAQFFGMDFIAWNPTSVAPGRYFASLGNPNFLAAYLAMIMPLIVIFFIESTSRFRRILLFVSFIVMFTALMGTWSRGGFLGLLGALDVIILFGVVRAFRALQTQSANRQANIGTLIKEWIDAHKMLSMTMAAALILLISISATFGRAHMLRMADTVIHIKDAVTVSRLHIWGPALGMIKENPILGSGLDTFKTVFPRYATPKFAAIDGANVSSRTAHNEILQVLATQGFVGLLIVTWLTVMLLINWWKAYQRSRERWQDRLVLVGMAASWTAYSIQNLFSFGVVAIDSLYWLMIAVIILLGESPKKQTALAPSQIPEENPNTFFSRLAPLRVVVILAMLGLAGFGSWQVLKTALADYAYNLGTIYRLRSMWDHCIVAFTRAHTLSPTEVKYAVYQGLAYEEKAKHVAPGQQLPLILKALEAYHRGAKMNPTNAYYLGNLGRAYAFASNVEPTNQTYSDNSIRYLNEAIVYAPVTVLFYQNLGMTYFGRRNYDDFVKIVDKLAVFNTVEASKLVFSAGNQLYNINDLGGCKTYYGKALEINPDYVEAHFNLGVTLARMGSEKEAIAHWQQALVLKPSFSPAKQMLERYQSDPQTMPGRVIMNK
ncbi:O-antigen ligase family protein [bacterium]|nr:O-antigen ligase family protein [bacterium]